MLTTLELEEIRRDDLASQVPVVLAQDDDEDETDNNSSDDDEDSNDLDDDLDVVETPVEPLEQIDDFDEDDFDDDFDDDFEEELEEEEEDFGAETDGGSGDFEDD